MHGMMTVIGRKIVEVTLIVAVDKVGKPGILTIMIVVFARVIPGEVS